jgi:SSS family solute:Na+ symporter
MDYMQMIFGFFNAPLFATFLLGMFWKKTTPWAAFIGLLIGTTTAVIHNFVLTNNYPMFTYSSAMAGNFWRATYAWTACFIATVLISFVTKPKPESELVGLCWGTSPPVEKVPMPFYKQPAVLGVIVILATVVLNVVFF